MICRNRPRSTSTCSATILAMASRNGRSDALIALRWRMEELGTRRSMLFKAALGMLRIFHPI